jgi:ferredoxin
MRFRVIEGRCSGHARCAAVAPQIYRLDDDGYNTVGEQEVSPGDEEMARRGARACPERAIEILED